MIKVMDVTKRYGPTRAAEGLSFTAPPGTVTGFLGPNGAGMTTTLLVRAPDPALLTQPVAAAILAGYAALIMTAAVLSERQPDA